MKIGYARVSTEDQHLDLQLKALKDAGCEQIFSDKASGKSDARPGLEEALSHLRAGDTLVVWKLDRFARSTAMLARTLIELNTRGVAFVSLTDQIDTATPAGRFYFHILSAVAELEADLNRERTTAGLQAARAKGKVGGRPRAITTKQATAMQVLFASGGIDAVRAAFPQVSTRTIYRYLSTAQVAATTRER